MSLIWQKSGGFKWEWILSQKEGEVVVMWMKGDRGVVGVGVGEK